MLFDSVVIVLYHQIRWQSTMLTLALSPPCLIMILYHRNNFPIPACCMILERSKSRRASGACCVDRSIGTMISDGIYSTVHLLLYSAIFVVVYRRRRRAVYLKHCTSAVERRASFTWLLLIGGENGRITPRMIQLSVPPGEPTAFFMLPMKRPIRHSRGCLSLAFGRPNRYQELCVQQGLKSAQRLDWSSFCGGDKLWS